MLILDIPHQCFCFLTISHIENTGSKSVCVGVDENGEGGAWINIKV
jgi:hypothetical protein